MLVFSKFRHPIILFGAIVWSVRVLSIIAFYFTDESMYEPIKNVFYAVVFHSIFLFGLTIGLLLFWSYFKRFRVLINIVSAITFGLSVIISNVDFILLRFTGNKFTPEVLRFYGLKYVLHPDVVDPLIQNPFSFLFLVLSLAALIIAFVKIGKKMSSGAEQHRFSFKALWLSFALMLTASFISERISQMHLNELRPPEIVFMKSLLNQEKYTPSDKIISRSKKNIRKFIGLEDEEPLMHDFPLFRKIESTEYTILDDKRLPDIFLIAVESLRGRELSFTQSSEDFAHTPSIDSLAQHSLVFPRFISNGWPSEEGFFCTMTSGIPHRLKHIAVSYNEINFDCLPKRLESMGYRTKSAWGTIPADRILGWCHKWFNETLHPDKEVWHDSDLVFIDKLIQAIKIHDKEEQSNPLFTYIQNGDTHMPFDPTSGFFANENQRQEAEKYLIPGNRHSRERYKKTLEWTDKNLGRLFSFLSNRENSENTIIVLIGDHSILTNENFGSGVKVAPTNAYVHTGALISGPDSILGMPRNMDFPSSQVDLMPTILSLLNYDKPIASLGRNLLENIPVIERRALSVRPGVFRLDMGLNSLYLNANNPSNYWYNDFYDLTYKKPNEVKNIMSRAEINDFYEMMYYWSYLLENDLILPKSEKLLNK